MSLRPSRVWAVAVRDLRQVHAGRGRWGLPALALGLLLPIGAVPLHLNLPRPEEAAALRVAGDIPTALADRLVADPKAAVKLEGESPVHVTARSVPGPLRAALDSLPGTSVRVVPRPLSLRLPGRSMLVALLAISLLTGPLAESLPGERSRGTLTVLLSASISRGELVAGKWLAWTGWAGLAALLSALSGIATGAQAPGLWPLALPMVAATAVALGLWLVAGAADVVGGAAIPMRVVPAISMGLAGLAWGLATVSPTLGAAVPLGGALLVAGGVLEGPLMLLVSALSAGLTTGLLLLRTAVYIDAAADADRAPRAGAGAALSVLGLWWLAVAGPGVWALAGNRQLVLPPDDGLLAGGLALGLAALVLGARAAAWPRLSWSAAGAGLGLLLGAGLAGLSALPLSFGLDNPLAIRLALSLGGASAPGVILAVALGQELAFRGELQRRLGWGAVLIWALAAGPQNPMLSAISGAALFGLSRKYGIVPCVIANLAWSILGTLLH